MHVIRPGSTLGFDTSVLDVETENSGIKARPVRSVVFPRIPPRVIRRFESPWLHSNDCMPGS